MKKNKLCAFLLAAVVTASASAGCLDKHKKDTPKPPRQEVSDNRSPVDLSAIGTNVINGELGTMVSENNMDFTLNAVIDPQVRDCGSKFIYFDITLRNNTATEYAMNTLNNFYIELPDGTKMYSEVRTQLYAESHFNKDKYFIDPFTIPSNGQFSGIIGGFAIEGDVSEFTLGFYPTGDDPNAKGTVIKYDITAADLAAPSAEILK